MDKYSEAMDSNENTAANYNPNEPDNAIVLEVEGDVSLTDSIEQPAYNEDINQDAASYSAPHQVLVRTYRLRK